jgi:hypothetical protein
VEGRYPIKAVLSEVQEGFIVSELDSEHELDAGNYRI